jgi:Protein of unknown function (DUF2510)/Domain of unknown function (DUF4333)
MGLIEYPTRLPSAGWYDDPYGQPHERWWDGQTWTDHINVIPPAQVSDYERLDYATPAYAVPDYATPSTPYAEPSNPYAAQGAPAAAPASIQFAAPVAAPSAPKNPYGSNLPMKQLVSAAEVGIGTYDTDSIAATDEIGGGQLDENGYRPFGAPVASIAGGFASNPYTANNALAGGSNPSANTGLILGAISVFINPLLIIAILGIRSSVLGFKRADFLQQSGYEPIGASKARWGIALSLVGLATTIMSIVIAIITVTTMVNATPTFEKSSIEKSLVASVSKVKQLNVAQVECPVKASAVAGSKFECLATMKDGLEAVVYVRVTNNKGDFAWTLGL